MFSCAKDGTSFHDGRKVARGMTVSLLCEFASAHDLKLMNVTQVDYLSATSQSVGPGDSKKMVITD